MTGRAAKRPPLAGADPALIKAELILKAQAEGFDVIGFTSAAAPAMQSERLHDFLLAGHHGTMGWMHERSHQRANPVHLWPEAHSAIMLGLNYGPDHDPNINLARRSAGNISVYARGDDYHDIMKPRLKAVGRWLAEQTGAELKVFVDTAPVMEKPLAMRAGLGWQGKHTNLVSRDFGSWLFLGAILTPLALPPDKAEPDHCGSCRACLDACPTDAFIAPYQLDARRCISYLTIEHAGPLPHALRKAMGNRIYGCDDCLAACPWNKFAHNASHAKLMARAELNDPPLAELSRLDDAAFRALFAKNPVKRSGRNRFIRNVLIAIGNSGDPALLPDAQSLLSDDSPLVRGAAIWACGELDTTRHWAETMLAHETDADVISELQRLLQPPG